MADTLLSKLPVSDLPEPAKQAWSQLNALTGDASFVEVFAQAPELLEFVMSEFYGKIFFGGRVDQRYKQLARLKLSMIHGCRTCNKQNTVGALEAGISQDEINALDDYEHGPFSEADKAVLRYTELMSMSNESQRLQPELYGQLNRHFNDAEICELGAVCAFVTGFAKLSFVLDLVEREPYCNFN